MGLKKKEHEKAGGVEVDLKFKIRVSVATDERPKIAVQAK